MNAEEQKRFSRKEETKKREKFKKSRDFKEMRRNKGMLKIYKDKKDGMMRFCGVKLSKQKQKKPLGPMIAENLDDARLEKNPYKRSKVYPKNQRSKKDVNKFDALRSFGKQDEGIKQGSTHKLYDIHDLVKDLMKKNEELDEENKALKQELRDKKCLKCDRKMIRTNGRGDYKEMLLKLLDQIENLYDCPLSYERLTEPAILPSGITIDQNFLQTLKNSRSKDPYNNELRVKQVITNRFAINLTDLLSSTYQSLSSLPPSSTRSLSTQTTSKLRSKSDISQISRLKTLLLKTLSQKHYLFFTTLATLFCRHPSALSLLLLHHISLVYSSSLPALGKAPVRKRQEVVEQIGVKHEGGRSSIPASLKKKSISTEGKIIVESYHTVM